MPTVQDIIDMVRVQPDKKFRLKDHAPASRFARELREHAGPWTSATGSWRHREDAIHFWNRLAMFNPVGKHPQCPRLNVLDGLPTTLAISQNAG